MSGSNRFRMTKDISNSHRIINRSQRKQFFQILRILFKMKAFEDNISMFCIRLLLREQSAIRCDRSPYDETLSFKMILRMRLLNISSLYILISRVTKMPYNTGGGVLQMLCRGVIIQSGRYKLRKSTSDLELISYLFTYVKDGFIKTASVIHSYSKQFN